MTSPCWPALRSVAGFLLKPLLNMSARASLLCPVDLSELSLGALHCAAAIAKQTDARLTILMVCDPSLPEVVDRLSGAGKSAANSERALRRFAASTLEATQIDASFAVRIGKAAAEILAAIATGDHSLVVMGTHGRRGPGKWLLGTVAQRVLRETTIPVLLVPIDPGLLPFPRLAELARPILAPIDFSAASQQQLEIASRIAATIGAELMVGHVVEPIDADLLSRSDAAELWEDQHRRAWQELRTLVFGLDDAPPSHLFVADGNPVDQITRWIRDHHVGLLVMALHSGSDSTPRIGSVTYRTIAATKTLTLALPPSVPVRLLSIGEIHHEHHDASSGRTSVRPPSVA